MNNFCPVRRKKTEQAPSGPVPGLKKVRTTVEYQEPIEEKAQTIEIPAREIIEDDEPLDKIGEFFNRIEVEQGWRIVVWRLPSFNRDGRSDSRADKVYLGNIPLDPDHYLETVQDMWGAGTFKFESKDPDSKFGPKWVEHIGEKPTPQNQNGRGVHYIMQGNGNVPPVEPAPVRDTLQELLDAGEKAQKLKRVFGWESEAPAVQATPVTATVEREPLQDRIIGAALEAALKSERSEQTLSDVLKAYLAPQKDESWVDLVKELVKPLAPVVMNLIGAYMQAQAARAQGQSAPPAQPQIAPPPVQTNPTDATWATATPFPGQQPTISSQWPALEVPGNAPVYDTFQGGSIAPAPLPGFPTTRPQDPDPFTEEDEEEMGRDDLVYNLAEMLESCVRMAASDPATVEAGRQEVMKYKARFPMMTGVIDALTTLPPEAIIGMLAMKVPQIATMINNDVAKQTIRDFQDALKRPEVIQ